MSYVISFLETEITSMPQKMKYYMGKHYNNTLCNGVTWMVFILLTIRLTFEMSVNALLKKMGFKEYLRTRLIKSLWYLGFYTCNYLYCSATLWKNDIDSVDEEKLSQLDLTQSISGNMILGYVLLCAFFVSSTIWEGVLCSFTAFNYLFLTGFVVFTYFISYIELAVLLAKSVCAFQIMVEFSRCLSCIVKANLNLPPQLVHVAFCSNVVLFINSYLAVIPKRFLMPIGRALTLNASASIMICLNATLWSWFLCELYISPIYKTLLHYWYHTANVVPECGGSAIECALFQPRNDLAHDLKIIRNEIKDNDNRMMALKHPKRSARLLLQTLKCVAKINRQVKVRRQLKEEEKKWLAEEEQEIANDIFDLDELENADSGQTDAVEADRTKDDGASVSGLKIDSLKDNVL